MGERPHVAWLQNAGTGIEVETLEVENRVSELSWDRVHDRLRGGSAAILPVAAAAKEHGFHLPMRTDQIQAEYLARRIADEIDALIWPTLSYGYYPAFAAYAGSIGLTGSTFEAIIGELLSGLLAFEPKSIFVLNAGVSTVPLIDAVISRTATSRRIRHVKIYSGPGFKAAVAELSEQAVGGHADEIETSIMLALAPEVVNMARAEASPPRPPAEGPLTPHDPGSPNYSGSGSLGDPTLATIAKGHTLVEAMIADVMQDVRARTR